MNFQPLTTTQIIVYLFLFSIIYYSFKLAVSILWGLNANEFFLAILKIIVKILKKKSCCAPEISIKISHPKQHLKLVFDVLQT